MGNLCNCFYYKRCGYCRERFIPIQDHVSSIVMYNYNLKKVRACSEHCYKQMMKYVVCRQNNNPYNDVFL